MTIEEIEIVVTAKVEEALQKFKEIAPTIQKSVKQAQEAFSKVDTKEMKNKVQQATDFVKKKTQELKQSSKNNEIAIKINNKDAKEQINQIQKQIDSLQEKINARKLELDFVKQNSKQMYINNNNNDGSVKENLGKNTEYIKLIKQEKELNTEIQTYNKLLEDAKNKMTELKDVSNLNEAQGPLDSFKKKLEFINPIIQAVKQSFKNVFTGAAFELDEDPFDLGESENLIILIETKIDKLEDKIKNFQEGKIELNDEDISKIEVELDKLYNQKEKIEKEGKGNFFQKMFSNTKKTRTAMQQISGLSNNIKNQINKISSNLKTGLGHVLKYATALFGIRSIYSTLSSSVQSWLSSQNAGAKQLSANIEYMKYAMGSVFASVIEYVTNLIYNLMKAVQSLVYAFSGVNIFAKATASSMKSASGSAKQTSKSLSSVHSEINNVSDNQNSGSSSGTPNIDLSKIENTSSSIIDAIKDGNWYEVGVTIGQKLNDAMNSIPWDKIQGTAKKIGKGIAETLNGFIATTDWNNAGNTFAQGINTAIYFGYNFVTTFDWEQFGKSIGDSINGFFNNIDWTAAGQTLSEGLKGCLNASFNAGMQIDWEDLAHNFEEFISNIDWSEIINMFFKNVGTGFGAVTSFLGTLIADIFSGIGSYFNDEIEECGGDIVLGILKGIGDAVLGIGQWIYENIFQPFIDGFKSAFGIHSPSKVMAEQGNFIIEGLFNGISSLVGKITGIWNNMKSTAIEIFTNIKTSITNKVTEIKNGISQKFQEAYNNIRSIFSNIGNFFSSVWNNIKNTFSNLGTSIGNAIGGAVKSGINGVISLVERTINSAIRMINNGIRMINLIPGVSVGTINTLSLPRLAKGNVAYDETLAVFGEYSGARSNPEITAPQSIIRETFEDVLSNYEGSKSNNSGELKTLVIQFGSTKVALEMERLLQQARRQNGTAYARI